MQKLWVTENDWLCFNFVSLSAPKQPGFAEQIDVPKNLAERILANQRETAAIQKILNDLKPKPNIEDLRSQMSQEAYEQAQDEALVRFAKRNLTGLNNPLVKVYWKEVQHNPDLLQGDGND
jgi:hypothetical protein